MKSSKTKISIAISLTLSAAFFVPAVYGVSIDVLNNKVADNSGGDALLFPFYTTTGANGNAATTSFSVTNTANVTVAVKIRFREQKVGFDALNFIAILSSYDKFDFWVTKGEDGIPIVEWNDNACVVGPEPGQKLAPFPYPETEMGITEADLASGHVEVFGMAALGANSCVNRTTGEPIPLEPGATCPATAITLEAASAYTGMGENRQPLDCQSLMDFFFNPQYLRTANLTARGELDDGNVVGGVIDNELAARSDFFADAPNSLIGSWNYRTSFSDTGMEDDGKALALQNSNITSENGAAVSPTMVPAQSDALCAEQATSASSNGNCVSARYAWDKREYFHPHLGDMRNLPNLQAALDAESVAGMSEWYKRDLYNYAYLDWIPENECNGGVGGENKVWCQLDSPRANMEQHAASNLRMVKCSDTNRSVVLDENIVFESLAKAQEVRLCSPTVSDD